MNLRRIEAALAVRIVRREAEFRVEGRKDDAQRAVEVLTRLGVVQYLEFPLLLFFLFLYHI